MECGTLASKTVSMFLRSEHIGDKRCIVEVRTNWSKLTDDDAARNLQAFVAQIPDMMSMLQHEMRKFSPMWRMDYTRASVYYSFIKLATLV